MISMAASARIVEPVDAKRRWVFKTPQNDIMMSLAIATHMAAPASRRSASSAFPTPTAKAGTGVHARSRRSKGLTIVANERYARTDTSVTGAGAEDRRRQARRGADRRLRARRPCCRSAR